MSTPRFPTLKGRGWGITRTPIFSTVVQTSDSGNSCRIARYADPIWEWDIPHNYLRSELEETPTLMGFFAGVFGQFQSFLYKDPEDFVAIGQPIGTGDGSATQFQLVRTMGISTQRIWEPNSSYQPYHVYFNSGVVDPVDYSISPGPNGGLITFVTAPTAGTAITADFGYDWRCRMSSDTADFTNFMYQRWSQDGLKFRTTRQ